MNRTGMGLAIALACGVGAIFAIDPTLDLAVARLFWSSELSDFPLRRSMNIYYARETAMWLARAAVLPAVAALALKFAFPRMRPLLPGRAAVLLVVTLALGPGLLVNSALKEHWNRPRPSHVVEFGGRDAFKPWFDNSGACPTNCSFVSGDVASAFWTVAIAAVMPAPYRVIGYVAAVSFGVAVSLQRMAVGAHFFTDVAFAGLLTFFVIWIAYAFLFRWRTTRTDDAAIEKRLAAAGLAFRAQVRRALGLFRSRPERRP